MEESLDILFYLFMIIMPFFSGLYFEKDFILSSCLILFLLLLEIISIVRNKKINKDDKKKIFNKKYLIIFLAIILISLLTYLIDYLLFHLEINTLLVIYGTVQILEMELFAYLCLLKYNKMNKIDKIDEKDKKDKKQLKLLKVNMQNFSIMISSNLMGLLLFFSEFYRNGRFEGTFYYANACAMFFLISLVTALNTRAKGKKTLLLKIVTILFDLVAIILTNSRFTYLLLVFYLFLELIKILVRRIKNNNEKNINEKNNTKNLKKFFNIKNVIFILLVLLLIISSSCIILNNDKIKDRFKASTITRDINLRLSYLDEANIIIKDYPFGLGYEGYLNHQEIKENKYKLRLVHNMPYQIVLNYGIIMFIFVLVLFIKYIDICIKNKKIFTYENIVLLLLLLHSLVDIGTSFLAIDNIVIMLIIRNMFREE